MEIRETAESSVGNLAMALGMMIADGMHEEQQECFVESVIVLAHKAGVPKENALKPFDFHRCVAEEIWTELDRQSFLKGVYR